MAIKYSFADNKVYGTEDINDITRCLTGGGVAPFVSKNSYNVSDLNAMTSAVAGSGVQLNGCKVTVQNPGTVEMTATVAQGIIFFESGIRLEVDSDGYVIELDPNTQGFVFAHYNPILQKADVVFAAELPTDGQCVLLAKITETGSVLDKRSYAHSKIATLGKNTTIAASFSVTEAELCDQEVGWDYYITGEIKDVNLSVYNYAIIETATPDFGVVVVDLNQSERYQVGVRAYYHTWYVQMISGRLCFVEATGGNAGYLLSGKYGEDLVVKLA